MSNQYKCLDNYDETESEADNRKHKMLKIIKGQQLTSLEMLW